MGKKQVCHLFCSLFHVSLLFLYTFSLNILVVATLFIVGIPVHWIVLPICYGGAVLVLARILGEKQKMHLLKIAFLGVFIFAILTHFSGTLYDCSYDGNAYHKVGIGLLKNGWNPLLSPPDALIAIPIMGDALGAEALWIETYCKATWIFSASLYAITANIESGKVYTLIGIFCAFSIICYWLLSIGKRPIFSISFSLISAFNPIAIAQIDSFYVDGFLHTLLFILVFALFIKTLNDSSINSTVVNSVIAASMIILGNIKFTGLLYGGIFCVVYYIWEATEEIRTHHKITKKAVRSFFSYAALAGVTVFWAGNSAYLTNFLRHGSFTYPLTGENPVDIMTCNSPFTDKNHFQNLFISLFSKLDNFVFSDNLVPVLKLPFSIHPSEIIILDTVDPRLSGFGIFFSGILVISTLILFYKLATATHNRLFYLALINTLICLALTFSISESWWARYAPYVYIYVLTAVFLVLDSPSRQMPLGLVFVLFILINNISFIGSIRQAFSYSNVVEYNIQAIQSMEPVNVCATLPGAYFNLQDADIPYIINPELAKDENVFSIGYMGLVWK